MLCVYLMSCTVASVTCRPMSVYPRVYRRRCLVSIPRVFGACVSVDLSECWNARTFLSLLSLYTGGGDLFLLFVRLFLLLLDRSGSSPASLKKTKKSVFLFFFIPASLSFSFLQLSPGRNPTVWKWKRKTSKSKQAMHLDSHATQGYLRSRTSRATSGEV